MTDSAASTDDVWTVQRILLWTADFLGQKGVDSPRLEAELLLAHARNCQRIRLYTDFETPLTDTERTRMREFVKRRASREPLAYITGHKEFYGRDFQVGPGVLVPRPETETLIDICLERIPKEQATRVCEIGFGSGCIAVTLAKQRSEVSVVATDISEVAAKFAAENRAAHRVESQIELMIGSLFDPITAAGIDRFDGLVSNPPYIRDDELSGLAAEVREHEPHEALVSGEDGMDVIRQLIQQAPQFLKPKAWIALEVDPQQCTAVGAMLTELGFQNVRVHKDVFENDRIVEAAWKGDEE